MFREFFSSNKRRSGRDSRPIRVGETVPPNEKRWGRKVLFVLHRLVQHRRRPEQKKGPSLPGGMKMADRMSVGCRSGE